MKWISSIAVLLITQTAFADYYSSVDNDTCWDGKNSHGGACMVVHDTEWSQYSQDKFIVTYRNTCDHRIYARFCNNRNGGSPECGASGISAGNTKKWATNNASGRYSYKWVGVTQGSKDWVCSGKVSGWNN